MTDQPAPLTDDQAFVAAIVCATEHAAAIPQQLRARALNAVGPALQARGEWLRLSSRKAVADAILIELKRELDALAEYENTITWMTTCTSCARILDSSIRETERAEKAEAELAALRAVSRGYCPACGRGDAAPTVDDWEQQKQRADRAEAKLRRYQSWLADQLAEAETRDQVTGEVPAELRISPHNGIASGLRAALYGLDRHLDGQGTGRPTPHGHVTTDAREWDGEKTGEQP